jgi:trigger factor
MQVTETKSEGLSREFAITIPASDIEGRVAARLNELVNQVNIPGFRPGKVPVALLRKRYGEAVMGEVLQAAVAETTSKALSERELQPAMQPKIEVKTFEDGKDLEFTMAVDVLPVIEPIDFRTVELERLKPIVGDEQVDESLQRMAQDFARTEPIAGARKAKEGDTVVVDFEGSVDGVAFEGGKADAYHLELGSGRFIPGFEEQVVGANAGDHLRVEVGFPEEYGNAELAGKAATFEVDVKEIREKAEPVVDEAFAKSLGVDNVDALKDQLRQRLEGEYATVSRARIKRQLLDKLDEAHGFEAPSGMVESELESIWSQFENARKNEELDAKDLEKSDDEIRAEYRKVAERRVRLGLLLAAVGQRNNIDVTPEEVNRALIQQAQNFPGQERQFIETYQKNDNLMASLRAPIFEDKVVDYILEMAQVDEREISVEELLREPEDDEAEAAPRKKRASGAGKGGKAKSAAKGPAKKKGAKKAKK